MNHPFCIGSDKPNSRPPSSHRGKEKELTLDDHSFQLVDWPTSLSKWDFYNDEQKIHDVYYKEMEAVLKRHTGCEYVHVFHHQLRNSDMSTKTEASGDRYGIFCFQVIQSLSDNMTVFRIPRRTFN